MPAAPAATVEADSAQATAGDGEPAAGAPGSAAPAAASLAAQVAEGYARLKELDPMRRGYYEDAEAGRAHVVARPMARA
jgi:hypothetical protein